MLRSVARLQGFRRWSTWVLIVWVAPLVLAACNQNGANY
jgi:hypothetical protein